LSITAELRSAICSHVDSFRNGCIHGWVLRRILTPGAERLLGRCTVALVHRERVVAQTLADRPRHDVAESMQGETQCGFTIEIPRSLLRSETETVIRLYTVPEMTELVGSPCIAIRGGSVVGARRWITSLVQELAPDQNGSWANIRNEPTAVDKAN
jgi:hypothetical protein